MIYLDNASTTKVDERVLEAVKPYMTEMYGNAGTLYEFGRKSAEAIDTARKQVAELIGASPEQIIFTSGGTEANNLALKGTLKYLHSSGKDCILTTSIEHDSILNTIKEITIKDGFCTYLNPPRCDGYVHYEDMVKTMDILEKQCGRTLGLVSVMHTNNETGIKNPDLKKICEECHRRGALFHTDCVQAAGCSKLNVDEIGCDFMSLSSHKIHGLKGVGALYVRDTSTLNPLICGGHSQEFGLRGGTENVAGIVGFGEACRILTTEIDESRKHIKEMMIAFLKSLYQNLEQLGFSGIVHINGYQEKSDKLMSEDTFSVDWNNKTVTWIYYNTDSWAGGQYVINRFSFDEICKGAHKATTGEIFTTEEFFDYLSEVAEQTLIDNWTEEFNEFEKHYPSPDFTGCTEETAQKMIDIAQGKICREEVDNNNLQEIIDGLGNHLGKAISLRFEGVDGETLLLMADSMGICISAGSACRSHEQNPSKVLTAMGLSDDEARDSIRVSFSRQNTIEEVIKAAQIIANCVQILKN